MTEDPLLLPDQSQKLKAHLSGLKQKFVIKCQSNWEICNNQERESVVVLDSGQMLGDHKTSEKRKVKIGTQN